MKRPPDGGLSIPRPPRSPTGYRPLSARERRSRIDVAHNRRLGWMLTLAREHGWVPAAGLPVEELIGIAREWLPADFPADMSDDVIASYVSSDGDRELALGLL